MSEGLFDLAPVVEREIENLDRIQAQIHNRAGQMARSARFQLDSLAGLSRQMSLPLNSMLDMAKRLAEDGADDGSSAGADYAQIIYSAGAHLRELIDHILDLARIESGDAALDIGAERFADLCRHFEQAYREVAQGAGLEFDIELATGLPPAIKTDGKRLRQILDNLLSNAFTFTARGGVSLRIAPTERGPMPSGEPTDCACKWVEFSVSDTGIGIPKARQDIVFEPFQRGDAMNGQVARGDGLGLFTCRQLAQILGGELCVISSEGAGSRFTLFLPVLPRPRGCNKRISPPAAIAAHKPVAASRQRKNPAAKPRQADPRRGGATTPDDDRVLVVADDVQFASLMLSQLRDGGYRGEAVIGLDKIEEALGETKPAAMVVGMMHRENGCRTVFDLLRHGRKMPGLPIGMICRGRGEIHKCLEIGGRWGDQDHGATAAVPASVLARLAAAAGRHMNKVLVADGAESLRPDSGVAWQAQGSEAVVFGTGALVADALRYGCFDGMVLGPTLMDMSAGELLKRLLGAELPYDLPIAILGREVEKEPVEIAMLKRRNGLAEALCEADLFLRRAVRPEVH